LDAFADACASYGITRVGLVVDAPGHSSIAQDCLKSKNVSSGQVYVSLYESIIDLVEAALEWTDAPHDVAAAQFAAYALSRLKEIEVADQALLQWQRLCAGEE
jgi:DNA polymerase III psi subunit